MRFRNKVALIAGGSAGIGLATAEALACQGASVVVVGRSERNAAAAARRISEAGGRAVGIGCDACNPSDAERAVAATVEEFGAIDILVNAVGGSTVVDRPAATVEELSFSDWQKLIAHNLDATFLFCHEAVPHMKQRKTGKIVNVSSTASRGLAPSGAAYAAAKGGIESFTRRLAREVAPYAICVNAVAPGITMTQRMADVWARRSDSEKRAAMAAVPLGRPGTPAEQAGAICFLASTDADYVTGVTLEVTGGL